MSYPAMIAATLIALCASAGSSFRTSQDSGRVPILPPRDPSEAEVRELSVDELLAKMPERAWQYSLDEWPLRSVPAELQRRAENGLMSAAEWADALRASEVLHTRPRWPAGKPLLFWIHQPPWLRNTRIRARAIEPDLGWIEANLTSPTNCVNCDLPHRKEERMLTLGPLPAGTSRVLFDVKVDQRDDPGVRYSHNKGEHTLWHGQVSIPVQIVADADSVVPPISSQEISDAVRQTITAEWNKVPEADGSRELRLTAGGPSMRDPPLQGVAFSLAVTLLHDGRAVSWSHVTTSECVNSFNWSSGLKGTCPLPTAPELSGPTSDLNGWELRFTGRSDEVLPIWEADHWWKGSFTMPLSKALGAARSK